MKAALEQLHRWIFLMQQVHEAKHYIARTEQLAHPELMQSFDEIWGVLLHFRGARNSYAKCFVSSGSGKTTLNAPTVFFTKPELVESHQRIMELRHKYVAHSDDNELEKTSFESTDTPSELVIRLQYALSFPFDRMYELRGLIQHLDGYVAEGLEKHVAGIARQVGKPVRILEGG
jgi:hypothetical protein